MKSIVCSPMIFPGPTFLSSVTGSPARSIQPQLEALFCFLQDNCFHFPQLKVTHTQFSPTFNFLDLPLRSSKKKLEIIWNLVFIDSSPSTSHWKSVRVQLTWDCSIRCRWASREWCWQHCKCFLTYLTFDRSARRRRFLESSKYFRKKKRTTRVRKYFHWKLLNR